MRLRPKNLVEVDWEGDGAVGGVREERYERGRGGGGRGRWVPGGGVPVGEEIEVGEEAVGPAAGGAAGEGDRGRRLGAAARRRRRQREGEGEWGGVGAGEEVVEALHCRRWRGRERGLALVRVFELSCFVLVG
uniref:ARC6 n=1 Tax=Arundo donax TaxID=35708 RepID=A0A0A9CT87_ARUDO